MNLQPSKEIEKVNKEAVISIQKILSSKNNSKTKIDVIREICNKATKDEHSIIHSVAWA